jgi:hypothetical protein
MIANPPTSQIWKEKNKKNPLHGILWNAIYLHFFPFAQKKQFSQIYTNPMSYKKHKAKGAGAAAALNMYFKQFQGGGWVLL